MNVVDLLAYVTYRDNLKRAISIVTLGVFAGSLALLLSLCCYLALGVVGALIIAVILLLTVVFGIYIFFVPPKITRQAACLLVDQIVGSKERVTTALGEPADFKPELNKATKDFLLREYASLPIETEQQVKIATSLALSKKQIMQVVGAVLIWIIIVITFLNIPTGPYENEVALLDKLIESPAVSQHPELRQKLKELKEALQSDSPDPNQVDAALARAEDQLRDVISADTGTSEQLLSSDGGGESKKLDDLKSSQPRPHPSTPSPNPSQELKQKDQNKQKPSSTQTPTPVPSTAPLSTPTPKVKNDPLKDRETDVQHSKSDQDQSKDDKKSAKDNKQGDQGDDSKNGDSDSKKEGGQGKGGGSKSDSGQGQSGKSPASSDAQGNQAADEKNSENKSGAKGQAGGKEGSGQGQNQENNEKESSSQNQQGGDEANTQSAKGEGDQKSELKKTKEALKQIREKVENQTANSERKGDSNSDSGSKKKEGDQNKSGSKGQQADSQDKGDSSSKEGQKESKKSESEGKENSGSQSESQSDKADSERKGPSSQENKSKSGDEFDSKPNSLEKTKSPIGEKGENKESSPSNQDNKNAQQPGVAREDEKSQRYGENVGDNEYGDGQKKGFNEVNIEDQNEQINKSQVDSTSEVRQNKAQANYKISIDKLRADRPESLKNIEDQRIPLEYKDAIK